MKLKNKTTVPMIKWLKRLLCLAFVGAIALTATAQRKTFYIDTDFIS